MDLWLTSIDPYSPLPSFFELFMTTSISQTIFTSTHSYLRQVLHAVSERLSEGASPPASPDASIFARLRSGLRALPPRLVKFLERHIDELHLLLLLSLECRYLRPAPPSSPLSSSSPPPPSPQSTFAESLYGGVRSKVVVVDDAVNPGSQTYQVRSLDGFDWKAAALASVLPPYIKSKLDKLYSRLAAEPSRRAGVRPSSSPGSGAAAPSQPSSRQQRAKALFLYLYPFLHVSYEGLFFAYHWTYLFGYSVYFSPVLHLLRQTVRRITAEDVTPSPSVMSSSLPSAPSPPPPPSSSPPPPSSSALPRVEPSTAALASGLLLLTSAWVYNARRRHAAIQLSSPPGVQEARPESSSASGGAATAPPPPASRSGALVPGVRLDDLSLGVVPSSSSSSSSSMSSSRPAPRPAPSLQVRGSLPPPQSFLSQLRRSSKSAFPRSPSSGQSGSASAAESALSASSSSSHPFPPMSFFPSSSSVRCPPPPQTSPPTCPLCLSRPLVNPAASTSGFVFCYRCLVSSIRRRDDDTFTDRCPVTGMECTEERIVRIFDNC